jgi:hypothetical protein
MKTFREIAEMHYASEPTNEFDKQYRENRINALERLLNEQLSQPPVSGSKYWYATDVYCCVLCGKETKYKGRVYDESKKGTKWHDEMCWEHML